jgi:hypothetical protein
LPDGDPQLRRQGGKEVEGARFRLDDGLDRAVVLVRDIASQELVDDEVGQLALEKQLTEHVNTQLELLEACWAVGVVVTCYVTRDKKSGAQLG